MKSRCEKSNDGKHHFTSHRHRTKAEFIAGRKYGGRIVTTYTCVCCRESTRRRPKRKGTS